MSTKRCPGQDTLFWRPEDIYEIPCPHCHYEVEFFKTDIKRKCPRCGGKVLNPRVDFSCAEWCEVARECLGPVVYDQLMEKQELERRREADLERLLATVHPDDLEVRRLFERLYRENRDPDQLLDFNQLYLLRDEDEELVKRATHYYSRFVNYSPL